MTSIKWLTTLFGFSALLCLSACGGGQSATTMVPDPGVLTPVDEQPSPQPQPVPRPNYIGFESVPTRPIAQSGDRLFVTNTSNNSVEIFQIDGSGRTEHRFSVSVGLEPVALALANEQQLWVVNKLSDSVSVIDLSRSIPVVVRTLLVGDEPQDIVFARGKAFVSAAHRGQHLRHPSLRMVEGAGDPQLHTAGIGRADVWVFDPQDLGETVGGRPVRIVNLFGDSPRGLAVSPEGSAVHVAVFHSGNQTTAVHEAVICYGFEDDDIGAQPCQVMDKITSPNGLEHGWLPGGRTAPGTNAHGEPQPWTSMIVKYDQASGQWRDNKGRNFSNAVRFTLPDQDVFSIDTTSLEKSQAFSGVGTTLFNLVAHPQSGDLFVSNSDANNATRFEGRGEFGGSTVQGNIAKTRVTHIDVKTSEVRPRHLNRHIDYSQLKASQETRAQSLSTPLQMVISKNGETLFLAAMGSDKVAVLPTAQLSQDKYWNGEDESFRPSISSQYYIDVPGGPVGLLLNEDLGQLYVYTKYDNALVTIDASTGSEQGRIGMFTPEPQAFREGRFMLYDARRSSSNGESSCASCHIFADTDHLSWDLGNPDAANTRNIQPFPLKHFPRLGCDLVGPTEASCKLLSIINGNGDLDSIASMKGPMGTQTLRGISTHGHMHWRGDRVNGYFGDDTEQKLDERLSFKNFIVAFEGLLGLDIHLPASVHASGKPADVLALEDDMDKFADFMLAVALPPNPIRNLDNSLSDSADLGADFFHGSRRSDGSADDFDINGPEVDGVNCEGCHGVDPAQGFYGTRGEIAHGGEIQILKVPQLRNLYTRVGMFGLPDREGFLPSHTKVHQGDQIRGFGFLHDGATDQLINFLRGGVFDDGESPCPIGMSSAHGCETNQGFVGIPDEPTRQGLVDYLMEFDSDLAPIVGQQITLNASTTGFVEPRIDLLLSRARTPFTSRILGGEVTECDLIAQGVIDSQQRGFFYHRDDRHFISDRVAEAPVAPNTLFNLARANNNSLTFTCTVPGQGWQLALDNNLDGNLNGDEVAK